MKKTVKWLLAAAVCVNSMSAHAVAYTVTKLGATVNGLFDINESGQVVSSIAGASGLSQAALWSNGAWQTLSPGEDSAALGLNDLGHVVGYTTVNGQAIATLWKDGNAQLLPGFAGERSAAYDLNNAGQIIGTSQRDVFFGGPVHVQWKNGQISELPGPVFNFGSPTAINEAGQIVGDSRIYRYHSGVRWNDGVPSWLGDPDQGTHANGINNHGAVAGQSLVNDVWTATIWSDDGVLTVNERYSNFIDINDAGAAVGSAYFGDAIDSKRALLYLGGQTYDLNDLLVGDRFGLGQLVDARAINNNGQIVVLGSLAGEFPDDAAHVFLLTPVPEPEHYAMLLLGLGMVGFAARRKARKSAAA